MCTYMILKNNNNNGMLSLNSKRKTWVHPSLSRLVKQNPTEKKVVEKHKFATTYSMYNNK